MATYTFAYTPHDLPPSDPFPRGQIVYRPLLVARLVVPTTHSSLRCIVWPDSGADHCVFPLSFAAAIGLDQLKMKMQNTAGVGNTGNPTYYETMRIEIPLGLGVSVSFTTMAGFTSGLEHLGFGLLGQSGFFETFATTFNHRARTFTIEVRDS